ncbi:MAG: transcriptional regulator [candidate division WS6 bacterium GW2011_GWF2_39_15]|uniref:Probable transcriptional regulatory protein UT34_C0001G0341 n=1 Tax=candidate division WS6 bacterium GW2011_GWF2_39_15 TaxID=1619100 RepID=A0A0G0N0E7_9BACT|nr:MAG: transcriptional regulator [candidate division WS6 bacterium GW2011_GWF2_39_15]
MSGHSKWSTIKHKKAINDAKKGKVFSKLSQLITHAARQGGGDINMNPSLRLLVAQAKEEGFPTDNIQKAIDKGAGSSDGVQLTEASYEGFGPGGIAIIVDVLTDNTNRVVSELRNMFEDFGGNLGEAGSVSWNFDTKGYINVKPGKMVKSEKFGEPDYFVEENIEEVMMLFMDVEGIEDIDISEDRTLDIYCEFKNLAKVRDAILKMGYVVLKAQLVKVPKMTKKIGEAELEKLNGAIETLEDYDDVQEIWTDLDQE